MSVIEKAVAAVRDAIQPRDAAYFRGLAAKINTRHADARRRQADNEARRRTLALAVQEGMADAADELQKAAAEADKIAQEVADLGAALAEARRCGADEERREADNVRERLVTAHRERQQVAIDAARDIETIGRQLAAAFIKLDETLDAVRMEYFKLRVSRADSPITVHEHRLARDRLEGIWSEWVYTIGVPHPLLGASKMEMRPNFQSFVAEVEKRLHDYDLAE